MGLRRAGATEVQEVLEAVSYSPGLQDSGDLEAATKTIIATAKQGTPDYTASLTVGSPPPRLSALRLCLRLQVTIDSFGGTPPASQLSYAIEVNGVQRATGAWTATGAQLAAVDLTTGQFNLGTANTIGVFLWVDQGNAIVSLCQVWLGMGSSNTTTPQTAMQINHTGLMALAAYLKRQGTGTPTLRLVSSAIAWLEFAVASGDSGKFMAPSFVGANPLLALIGTVATDLNYITTISAYLRREE